MLDVPNVQIGGWTVARAENRLKSAERTIQVEPRAMDVLLLLAQHAGEVVSVDELLTSVWRGAIVGDGSVYLAISQLRRALDDPAQSTRHIETIPKRGYRLTVPVKYSDHAKCPSIAVLPFQNLTAESEHAYFADGLTVELLNALCRIRSLRVAGQTSSFRFKDTKDDVRAIGAALAVDYLLEGSVRKSDDRLRIAVRLSDARTRFQIWSRTYESRFSDIFAIQDDVACAVANALQIALGVGELGSTPGMTRNVAAYEEYLKATALNLEWRPDATALAIEHLQRAVVLDPTFSVAWALLHGVCFNGVGVAPERAVEWQRKGTAALERASALAPNTPEVLLQAAIHEVDNGNWQSAGGAYERLWQRYAELGTPHRAAESRGIFLLLTGRAKEAADELERVRALDPLVVAFAHFLGSAYLATGHFAAAFAEVDCGLRLGGLEPLLRNTALAAALATRDRTAVERRIAAFPENDPGCAIHRALLPLLEKPGRARVEICGRAGAVDPLQSTALAQWAAYFGYSELAFELLAAAVIQSRRPFALWQPLMRDVRKLRAFRKFVRDIGLVDYWRTFGWSDYSRPRGDRDFVCE
jgi:TolB-like protein